MSVGREAELGDEVADGDSVFSGDGGGDDFGFAARQGDDRLAFGAPVDGSAVPHDGPSGGGLLECPIGV